MIGWLCGWLWNRRQGAVVTGLGSLVLLFRSQRAAARWLERVRIEDANLAATKDWEATSWPRP